MNIDVVIPLFNEESGLRFFWEKLTETFSCQKEFDVRFLMVNDGSTDETGVILDELAGKDHRVKVIHLWGNHGHQRALTAGLDHARGDAVLMMDGDGQHPPLHALAMIRKFIELAGKVDVIQGVRSGRQGNWQKNLTSRMFYLVQKMVIPGIDLNPGASDFRVISGRLVRRLKNYADRHRNLRVLLATLKLPTHNMPYTVERRIAGTTRYDLKQMIALATDGWFAFTLGPLRISFFLMVSSLGLVFLYVAYVVYAFALGITIPGWSSIIALIAFLFSVLFGVLAIISAYVSRIYVDTRGHPAYVELVKQGDSEAYSETSKGQS